MRQSLPLFVLLAALSQVAYLFSQERFDSSPHKGFLKSPTEQVIVEIREPFEVKYVRGTIRDAMGQPLTVTDFEIRDASGRVRGSKTDRFGGFKISNVSPGTYTFKNTRNGFQSVVGKITVSKKPKNDAPIQLTMPFGV
jgi:Carboxypeptidase regulatory-like domain